MKLLETQTLVGVCFIIKQECVNSSTLSKLFALWDFFCLFFLVNNWVMGEKVTVSGRLAGAVAASQSHLAGK